MDILESSSLSSQNDSHCRERGEHAKHKSSEVGWSMAYRLVSLCTRCAEVRAESSTRVRGADPEESWTCPFNDIHSLCCMSCRGIRQLPRYGRVSETVGNASHSCSGSNPTGRIWPGCIFPRILMWQRTWGEYYPSTRTPITRQYSWQ